MRMLTKSLPIGMGLLSGLTLANTALAQAKGAEDSVRDNAVQTLAGGQALTDMIAEKPAYLITSSATTCPLKAAIVGWISCRSHGIFFSKGH